MRFQEFFVDRDGVVDASRERMLGREAIEDGNYLCACKARDRDCLRQRARIGIEAAAVKVDQHAVAFFRRDRQRSDYAHGDAGDSVRRDPRWIEFLRRFANSCLPLVG